MTNKHVKQARRLLAILLSASMLAACAGPKTPAPSETSSAQYEQYKSENVSVQNQFDALTQTIFKEELKNSGLDLHYTLADPASRGITEVPDTFGEFSLGNMKKNYGEMQDLKKALGSIDIKKLTKEQKLTYKILSSYLETELSSEGLELYAQPLTSTIGIQAQLPILLAEYSFYSKEDVDHYLALLSTIDTYYGQILEFEKEKSEAGLFMCDTAADHVLQSCEAYLIQPDHSFLAETFNERVDALTDASPEEKAAYNEQNLAVLKEHFIPAYKNLIDGITSLMGTGTNEKGLSEFPQGKEYFEYLVKSNTATSYDSVVKLQKAIEKQLNSDLKALGEIVQTHPELVDALDTYAFQYTKPDEILETLKGQISKDFPALPKCSYKVKYVPKALEGSLSPAFYLVPPLDRYQDNVIYINGGTRFQNEDLFPTLAHEGYPGHLYQNVYFISNNTCDLRKILSFSSYSEGWATYVEYYSYTLDNGLDPNMGQLLAHNAAISLGLYALLDICINYDGWDKGQVKEYLSKFYNIGDSDVADTIYYSLVENPTNYMEYYVGYMEIMEMRDTAEKILKDQFDLKAFHTFLLDIGPAQFSIIQPYFRLWLAEQMDQ